MVHGFVCDDNSGAAISGGVVCGREQSVGMRSSDSHPAIESLFELQSSGGIIQERFIQRPVSVLL
jgi:hypothetical protein